MGETRREQQRRRRDGLRLRGAALLGKTKRAGGNEPLPGLQCGGELLLLMLLRVLLVMLLVLLLALLLTLLLRSGLLDLLTADHEGNAAVEGGSTGRKAHDCGQVRAHC